MRSMHCSGLWAETHWISGFRFRLLKAAAILLHFQISSVEKTHQRRNPGTPASEEEEPHRGPTRASFNAETTAPIGFPGQWRQTLSSIPWTKLV